jgi:hypothetical protein
MMCHGDVALDTRKRHNPIAKAETGMKMRGPYRSINLPTTKLDRLADTRLVVCVHPNWLLDMFNALDIGRTKRPKLRFPVAIVEKFTAHIVATITQP